MVKIEPKNVSHVIQNNIIATECVQSREASKS